MKNLISLILSLLVAFPVHAAGPVIWGPGGAQNISSGPVYDNSIPYIKQPTTNYIANQSGLIDTTGWTASGTATVTRATTGLPRATTVGSGLSLASGSADDYVQYCWTIDSADTNTKLEWSWTQAPGSFTAGDFVAQVYSFTTASCGGSATQLNIDQVASGQDYSIPDYTGALNVSFDTSDALYYGIRYTRKANSSTLVVSNVIVGPGNILPMPAVGGPYQTYTPTFSAGFGTVTDSNFEWTRDGTDILIRGRFTTGTTTTGNPTITLPAGLTVGVTASSGYASYGTFAANNVSLPKMGNVIAATGSATLVLDNDAVSLPNTNAILESSIAVAITNVRIPIAEWAGAPNYAGSNDVEYVYNTSVTDATDTTSFGYGPSGTPFPSSAFTGRRDKRVRFLTPIQVTDAIFVQVDLDGTGRWINLGDISSAGVGSRNISAMVFQNGIYYGFGAYRVVNSTDVDVAFGRYAYPSGATYAANGADWSATTGQGKWRVVKVKAGSAVGFGYATETQSGLVSTGAQTFSGAKTFKGNLEGYVIRSQNSEDTSTAVFKNNATTRSIASGGTGDFDSTSNSWLGLAIVVNVSQGTSDLIFLSAAGGTPTKVTSGITTGSGFAYSVVNGLGTNRALRITNNTGSTRNVRVIFLL